MTIYEDSLYRNDIGEAWQYKVRKHFAESEKYDPYWKDYILDIISNMGR